MRKYFWNAGGAKRFFSLRIQVIVFLLLCSGAALALFSLNLDQGKFRIRAGEVTSENLIAAQAIVDAASTERLQRQAVAGVLPVEYVEPVVLIEVKKDLDRLFAALNRAREAFPEDPDLAMARLLETTYPADITLEVQEAAALANAEPEMLRALNQDVVDLLSQSLGTGITADQLEEERVKLVQTMDTLREYHEPLRVFGGKAASRLLRPNRFVDESVTELRRQEARNAVESVMIAKGTVIAPAGTLLNEEHIALLKEAGMLVQESRERSLQLLGAALMIFLAVIYLTAYFYTQGGVLKEPRIIYLVGILMISMLGAALLTKGISPWLYPFAFFPMLLTLLVDFKTAVVLNTFVCFFISAFFGIEPGQLLVYWLSGFASAISIRRAEQRSALFLAGLTGALVGVLLVFGTGFAIGERLQELLYRSASVGMAGVFSSVLLLGSMPVWEIGFKILTPITLLELSNPNHPLLKKLLMEAPGTYHHSILVGNLSESAAHAIGANALLARVASFYHDIGKVQMPHYFVENQMGGFNPHDTLNPEISVKVIRDHVEVGLKLAAEYRLPKEIREVIEQHHGNSLIRYFYHKASQEAPGDSLNPTKYSYSGRTPRSRESAIIMLADSVEAAVRSLTDMSPESVRGMITKIFDEKLNSGQLALCPLTFAELTMIAERFEAILAGVYHERIQYPELTQPLQEDNSVGTDLR